MVAKMKKIDTHLHVWASPEEVMSVISHIETSVLRPIRMYNIETSRFPDFTHVDHHLRLGLPILASSDPTGTLKWEMWFVWREFFSLHMCILRSHCYFSD